MDCRACNAPNEAGRKFCGECGAALVSACPVCGSTANPPTAKFCGECGGPLRPSAAVPSSAIAPAAPGALPGQPPVAERRVVSVLFTDLVGFTTFSEGRDPEEVREMLSRYFALTERLVDRYGGTVEKFIGDAVMAMWGAPTAREDDAERAVRCGLDLVDAVAAFGAEIGVPTLAARSGVMTGEAAVNLGARGQGMVAGDMVNTAARAQSAAPPGGVMVGEETRWATEAVIAYQDAGEFELKGKAQRLRLWRAERVVAARRGALRAAALEAPFVGRQRELRLLKELFHATAEEGRAHLVLGIGIAGVGKSRLAWEFYKYVDGLPGEVFWHQGRCTQSGDGVTYAALAEIVRQRAGIEDGEDAGTAREKLQQAAAAAVPDAAEREWVEPRLAHLLGLEGDATRSRDDLFPAWRLFFERLSRAAPVVLVVEDLQWADTSLVEFVEYLLDWSRAHPILVLTLARPDLAHRHPGFAAGKRNFTSISVEPLPDPAMTELLDRLVPGIPADAGARILDQADGVPLYAVETVRMLVDRGLLVAEDGRFRLAGPLVDLDVPSTLHSLVAARLDGLNPAERAVVQDVSVLGKTFTRDAVAAVSGLADRDVESILVSLLHKEILFLESDPRSPERGRCGFLQDLTRQVALETLSRRDRKARHLRAAAWLEQAPEETPDVVEVIAAHYLSAYEAVPGDPDAAALREKSVETLVRAGERAASLGGSVDALRYFQQAARLAAGPAEQAGLLERAGQMAWDAGQTDTAFDLYSEARAGFESLGQRHPAARVTARIGMVEVALGRHKEAIASMEAAYDVLRTDPPDEDFATLAVTLGRNLFFVGELDRAAAAIDTALDVAETLGFPDVLSRALNIEGHFALQRRHFEKAQALSGHALQVALRHEYSAAALGAYLQLASIATAQDRYAEAAEYERAGVALARRVGNRRQEWGLLAGLVYDLRVAGQWDEALEHAAALPRDEGSIGVWQNAAGGVIPIALARGDLQQAHEILALIARLESSADVHQRVSYAVAKTQLLRAEGRHAEALDAGERLLAELAAVEPGGGAWTTETLVETVEAALALGDLPKATELLAATDRLPAGQRGPYLRAETHRLRARLAAVRGDHAAAEHRFAGAAKGFRDLDMPFRLAVTLTEEAEWRIARSATPAEAAVAEAQEIFGRLGARPWSERLARLGGRPR